VLLLAILQELRFAPAAHLASTLTGVNYPDTHRATGPFPVWHMMASYAFLVSLLATALLLSGSAAVMRRGTLLAVLVMALGALLATVTVAPLVGAVAGIVLLAYWYRRISVTLAPLAAMGIVGAFFFGNEFSGRYTSQYSTSSAALDPQSIHYRLQVWHDQYLPVIARHPITGYGPDLPPQILWPYTENVYITMLMRGGIILLTIYLAWNVALAVVATRAARTPDSSEHRAVARVVVVALAALVPMHMFAPYFVGSGLAQLLWVLAGVAVAGCAAGVRSPASAAAHGRDGDPRLHRGARAAAEPAA
jgi:O-antigen ligase